MDDCYWRCVVHHLLRLRRSTLYVAIFVSFVTITFAVYCVSIWRLPHRHQQQMNNELLIPSLLDSQPAVDETTRCNNIIINKQVEHRPIVILYWTKFFETNDFEVGLGSKPFAECDNKIISHSSCLTTTDRGLFNDSDAVIFHGRDLHANDLPPAAWRRPHQQFVFYLLESPVHTDLSMLNQPVFIHYFNRTMTYRRDSDIVELHPYGRLRCIHRPAVSAAVFNSCAEFPALSASDGKPSTTGPALPASSSSQKNKNKNRTIAWFVSNCQSNSQRESLVRKLSQFIAVDVYGKCGNGSHRCSNKSECDRLLSDSYRFYLSFENSLCPDYVTEKLYRPLAHDTVPVVYGGSNYSFYLPSGSYINAMDYKSPEDLADYLKKLMIDDALYLNYFKWRDQYQVIQSPLDGWCHLCQLLMDPPDVEKNKTKSYANMAEWWSGKTTNQTCLSPPKTLAVV
jgi:alpha-1,3-fucosyltransferase